MNLALALVGERLGGKERDCLATGQELARLGHRVTLLAPTVPNFSTNTIAVETIPISAVTNHGRLRAFSRSLRGLKEQGGFDAIIAFDMLPGADFLYAADECWADSASGIRRWLPRHRCRLQLEQGVFSASSTTRVFYLTERQRDAFWRVYGSAPDRSIVLPVHADRFPAIYYAERSRIRSELSLDEGVSVAISVAAKPAEKRKGLDRTMAAMAAIQELHLIVVGSADKQIEKRARALGISDRIRFVEYRNDVPNFIGSADFLLHPAREEAAGLVIVEALLGGIPAIVTERCGYAQEVLRSGAGVVLDSPFQPDAFVRAIRYTISNAGDLRRRAREHAARLKEGESWLQRIAREVESFGLHP